MWIQNKLQATDGSYLMELAKLAIEKDVSVDLIVDREGYEKARDGARQTKKIQPMVDYLYRNPQLQEQLAFLFDFVPSRWLLGHEIPMVMARRERHDITKTEFKAGSDAYTWTRVNKLQGICLSGGGIRSATFNLGILQGLAGLKMLKNFDYLSSVSGGGYIHEWLAGWIKREDERGNNGLEVVQEKLKPLPAGKDLPFQPEPIRWLRRYSNYLTPQKGFFTADTWVAISIWLRNTFLNQLILVSGLFFLVLLPHAFSPWLDQFPDDWAAMFALVLFVFAGAVMILALHREYERVRYLDKHPDEKIQKESPRRFGGELTVQFAVVLPLLCSAVLFLVRTRRCLREGDLVAVFLLLAALMASLALAGGAFRSYKVNHGLVDLLKVLPSKGELSLGKRGLRMVRAAWVLFKGVFALAILNGILAAIAGTGLVVVIAWLLGARLPGTFDSFLAPITWQLPAWVSTTPEDTGTWLWRLQLVLGTPALLVVPFFTMVIAAGLVGRSFPDWLREWLARVRAWGMLFMLGWLLYVGISLLGPLVFSGYAAWEQSASYKKLVGSIKWTALLAWIATTAGSVLAGNSSKATGAKNDSAPMLNLLAGVGPFVFVLGLLVILSRFADAGFRAAYAASQPGPQILLFVLPLGIFLLFGWRVDVNDFSMNSFYRNRLTRCYLGATNTQRDPNPLTGFDDRDTRGMQISRLRPDPSDSTKGYSGPLPIICTTLNLTFGEDLAWQERKAASFAFSPLYSGYTVGWTAARTGRSLSFNGFVPTAQYVNPDGGMNISTAVAISGAAVSPNWGYHTNPATAFLMTMFNVRLGWWLFNPRRSALAGAVPGEVVESTVWPSPKFAPLELAKELLGMTDDTSKYVYLSDGGHFENMGLYELVRRRCQRIVICDSEQDSNYTFEGLGNAIRKCRIDFGVEITLDDLTLLQPNPPHGGNSKVHFAKGKIRYPETPEKPEAPDKGQGDILYIKASITGASEQPQGEKGIVSAVATEPADIFNYKLQHDAFPHDTTANQWFTESQFESYRRLGQHVVDEIQSCTGWEKFL